MPNKNIKEAGKKTRFSSDNQPTGKAKSNGKKKALLLREFAKQLVTGQLKDNVKPIAEQLGIDIETVNVEMALHMSQLQKAIVSGDTMAYNSVLNRILGKVKEHIEVNDVTKKKPESILKFKDYNKDGDK